MHTYKIHDLEELIKAAKTHSLEITKVFPLDTEEEIRLFNLLLKAYIEARYNKILCYNEGRYRSLNPTCRAFSSDHQRSLRK